MQRRTFRNKSPYTIKIYQRVMVGQYGDVPKEFGYTDDMSELSDEELLELYNEYKEQYPSGYLIAIYKNDKLYAMSTLKGDDNIYDADYARNWNDRKQPDISWETYDGSSGHWAVYAYTNYVTKFEESYNISTLDFKKLKIYDSLA